MGVPFLRYRRDGPVAKSIVQPPLGGVEINEDGFSRGELLPVFTIIKITGTYGVCLASAMRLPACRQRLPPTCDVFMHPVYLSAFVYQKRFAKDVTWVTFAWDVSGVRRMKWRA